MKAPEDVKINLSVQPGAPQNEVTGCINGGWRIRIAAPPVAGRANRMLIEYLSVILDIPKTRIIIIRGETGRKKVVALAGLTREEVLLRLADRMKNQ
jgi:uncharacterized protein (TIGR00251 family)